MNKLRNGHHHHSAKGSKHDKRGHQHDDKSEHHLTDSQQTGSNDGDSHLEKTAVSDDAETSIDQNSTNQNTDDEKQAQSSNASRHHHNQTTKSDVTGDRQNDSNMHKKKEGTVGNRKCRDSVFLVVFLTFIGGMAFASWRAYISGNPLRIVYGTDSWGNICNQENDVIPGIAGSGQDLQYTRYLYFFNSSVVEYSNTTVSIEFSIRVCVKSCPERTLVTVEDVLNFTSLTGSSLCKYGTKLSNYGSNDSWGFPVCPPLPVFKQEIFLNRCVPASLTRRLEYVWTTINSFFNILDDNLIEKAVSDITTVWREILWLCGIAVGMAFLLVLALQFVAGYIIWVIVLGMVLGTITASFICWFHLYNAFVKNESKGEHETNIEEEKQMRHWLIAASSVTIVTIVVLIVLLVIRRHIRLVVELFRQAGRAIMKMPFLLLQPILTLMILAIVVGALGFIFLYVETAGYLVPEKNTGFVALQTDRILKYMKWYYLLGFLWIFQFIMACHRLTVSGSVAIWYFTRDKAQLSYPVLTAIYRVIRYHLGSVALGSLLVTFVSFFRLIFSFIDKRLKNREHPVAVFFYSCFQCCLRCFQYFIQFLDSNAYVEIAIHGYGFCFAARRAFRIIVSNALRLAAINSVGDFVLFLGKIATVSVVTIVGIQLMSTRDDLFYFWLPTTMSAIFAYFIASCFMSVYETTIDTIFVCFFEDLMINDGVDKPYYMSVGLKNCMPSRYRPR